MVANKILMADLSSSMMSKAEASMMLKKKGICDIDCIKINCDPGQFPICEYGTCGCTFDGTREQAKLEAIKTIPQQLTNTAHSKIKQTKISTRSSTCLKFKFKFSNYRGRSCDVWKVDIH